MSSVKDLTSPLFRTSAWKWWICGLLMMATMINYMDRLTLNQTAKRVKEELGLTNEQYGQVEAAFNYAFAVGALFIGWTADRWNVRWIYPLALLGWSAAGIATGFAETVYHLTVCRFVLGLFESGHWPCALRTTQRILKPDERTLGNSILQSGAALGSIITPLVVLGLVDGPGSWSRPFFVVGAFGTAWVLLWLTSVRRDDLAPWPANIQWGSKNGNDSLAVPSIWKVCWTRKFLVCVITVVTINLTWHFFRVWLPLFMQEGRDYTERQTNYFTSAYYLCADVGSLAAGFATLYLSRGWVSIHTSRVIVFSVCACLTLSSILVGVLPPGPLMLVFMLLFGFGALGLFPVYYSLSQELTVTHQGKLTGILSFTTWVATAIMHPIVGSWFDRTTNYSLAVALAGLPPLLALAALLFLWDADSAKPSREAVPV
jgi:ACS family hexuronate transporter-like MFS transporter